MGSLLLSNSINSKVMFKGDNDILMLSLSEANNWFMCSVAHEFQSQFGYLQYS